MIFDLNTSSVGFVGTRGTRIVSGMEETCFGYTVEAGDPKVARPNPKVEIMAPFKDAKNHRPCIENDLELESGRGCENWAEGSKTGRLTDCGGVPREISAKY